jgi:phospholipid/cholesterol/gamma-HCH transport system substrate-binding protein
MVTKSQKIRLGIFITISLLALIIVIIILVAPKFLEKRDIYFVGFTDISVTGLQKGSSVKYHGITVGHVSDVFIDPQDLTRIIIELSLDQGTPIKEDTQAEIAFLGITGLKFIELQGGSAEADPLPPGSFIQPGKSMSETVTDKAEILAAKTEIILNNLAALTAPDNWNKILALTDNAAQTIAELHDILSANREALTNTIAYAEQITSDLHTLTSSDTLGLIIDNLAEASHSLKESDLVRLIKEMNTALEHTNNLLRDVEVIFSKSRTDLYFSIESMRESADYLSQFSRTISEDHSVLIRGARPQNAPDDLLERHDENP